MRRALSVCLLFLILCGARAVRADITDLLNILRPVEAAPRTLSRSPPRKLLFNGHPLNVVSGRTPESIDQVLDFYERSFSREPAGKVTQPMQRQRGRDFGALVTVDAPLLPTLQAMRATRQHYTLTAPLRMAYARRAAGGEASYTDYLAIWSDEAMGKDILAPSADLDAPGMDAPDTPRPPGGVRSFNMYEPAAGYLVVSYDVPGSAQAALESTLQVLRGAGFSPDPGFAAAANAKGKRLVRMERQGQELLVSALPKKRTQEDCVVTYLVRNRAPHR